MTPVLYDPDDVTNRSPPMVEQKINYALEEPPPPFLPPSNYPLGTSTSRKLNQPESQAPTGLGDSVLMKSLAPNRPDIADHACENPLTAWSSEDKEREKERRLNERLNERLNGRLHERLHERLNDEEMERSDENQNQRIEDSNTNTALPLPEIKPDFVHPQRPRLQSFVNRSAEPIRISPPFHDSTDLNRKLPSLQPFQSPPSPATGTSPDTSNTQSLPSISSALSALGPEFSPVPITALTPTYSYPSSATSRNDSPHERQLPGILSQQIPISPFSHFSPVSAKDVSTQPSPASQPTAWRAIPSKPPVPSLPPPMPHVETTPMIPMASAPYDMSSMTAKSPVTSYPTPTEQISPGQLPDRSFISHLSTINPNGATCSGSYKCTHPGCNAAPFQTQYLLNSHANVHSQDRPHFCPEEGCPRGLGGKGFKRKNEMMRHGLVHNSPGYVCPFCPDQQHKYPRPDNLQRHVRVHHVDKNKDDPILRQVLAQRPIGSTRGRRRRMNS